MRVVIDTNLVLTCISRKSHLHWIFQKLIDGEFEICVTTEILNEYAEILERHMSYELAEYVVKTILNLAQTHQIDIYYKWNLIRDADDNKFVDCAIASNAKYLVSHDKHFNILKTINFPKVEVISAEEFKAYLDERK
ncbi:MAG: putative toxin-antitoxin system toxin component, PIN family [Saprospiraceae bacterium]